MRDGRIGIGLLGCGRIAGLHAAGYRDHPGAALVAVCDRDPERAAALAGPSRARVHTDVARFLDDPAVDAVDVCTPHDCHREHALAALAAGKHVSLQKPPVHTLADLDALGAAAARSGRTLRVFENFMHYPPHRRALGLVAEGAIGQPLSVRLKTAAGRPDAGWAIEPESLAWRMDPARCGGGPTTFDHGYHCYTLARRFGPAEIERVHAFVHWTPFGDGRAYDGPALVSWRYAGDPARYGSWEVIASLGLRVRSRYYVSDDRLEVHGTEGIVWVNRCTGKLLEEPALVLYRDGETRAFHDLETDWAASFRLGAHDFVDALREGRQPEQDLGEARATLAMALAVGRSAGEGREVTIAEILEG